MKPSLLLSISLFALGSCASRPSAGAPSPALPPADDLGLAPVQGPLVFPPETREIHFAWLVDELARLTGQELVYDAAVRQALEQEQEFLDQTAPVPTDEVYPFVEALLIQRGFSLALLKTGTPTMVEVIHPRSSGRTEIPAVVVQEHQLAALERHPALLAQHAMTFRNIDSRQLQTQLRQLLVDPSGISNVVPAGERSLLIQSYGMRITRLASLLGEVDRASGVLVPPQTQAEQATTPR